MKIKLGTLDQGVFDLAGTGKENLKLAVVRSKKQPVLTSEPKMCPFREEFVPFDAPGP